MWLILGLPLSETVITILLMVRRSGSQMVFGLIIALLPFELVGLVGLGSAYSLSLSLFEE